MNNNTPQKKTTTTIKGLKSTPTVSKEARTDWPTGEQSPSQATDSTGLQAALSNVVQSALPNGPGEQSAEFWISQVLDTLNFLYSRIKLPLDLRNYVNALVGASAGNAEWFECTDRELGVRMIGDAEDGNSPGALKKRGYRLRKKLIEWQRTHKYVLVEVDSGYATAERNPKTGQVITNPDGTLALEFHKTRYRLPVLPHAKQILLEAFSNPNMRGDLSLTAKRLMELLRDEPKQWDSAGRLDENKQLRRYRKQAITNSKQFIELVRKQGDDPRYYFEALIEEIEEQALLPDD